MPLLSISSFFLYYSSVYVLSLIICRFPIVMRGWAEKLHLHQPLHPCRNQALQWLFHAVVKTPFCGNFASSMHENSCWCHIASNQSLLTAYLSLSFLKNRCIDDDDENPHYCFSCLGFFFLTTLCCPLGTAQYRETFYFAINANNNSSNSALFLMCALIFSLSTNLLYLHSICFSRENYEDILWNQNQHCDLTEKIQILYHDIFLVKMFRKLSK